MLAVGPSPVVTLQAERQARRPDGPDPKDLSLDLYCRIRTFIVWSSLSFQAPDLYLKLLNIHFKVHALGIKHFSFKRLYFKDPG